MTLPNQVNDDGGKREKKEVEKTLNETFFPLP